MSANKNNIIIGFDLDGVIADHTELKIRLAAKRGFKLKPEQTPSDIMKNLLPESVNAAIQRDLYHNSEISRLIPLARGVKTFLCELKKRNSPFFLISRRKNADLAIALLRIRGLWPEYFNEANAFFVAKAEDKNLRALELGVTHYIDDQPSVLNKLVCVRNKILFDKFGVFADVQFCDRVQSWRELAGIFGL